MIGSELIERLNIPEEKFNSYSGGIIPSIFVENDNNFIIRMLFDKEKKFLMFWICLLGSKFQAKEFTYIFEVKVSGRKVTYEGPVQYIDENISDIVKSQMGLIVSYNIIQSCAQENECYDVEYRIRIISLANKNNLPFESENYETKKPLRKKLKIEKTQ